MVIDHLQGLIAAPFTPMKPDGSLHLSQIPDYYHLLRENGISGAFICGSTGEGVSLTAAEKMEVAETWADAVKHDDTFKVIAFLGGTNIKECKQLALHARKTGLYAVAFTAPFYFKPVDVTALASCCKSIADAVPDMPFYYYHIPVLTGVHFAMYDLLQAVDADIPNFAGVKYTHEDLMDFFSCLNFKDGRYDMLWGRDETMLSALILGAKAAVGSTFNYIAPLYHELVAAFEKGDHETAKALQQKSIDFIRLLGKFGGIATGKAYMKLTGIDCGHFRLPVQNMTTETFECFSREVHTLSFDRYKSKLPQLSKS